MQLRWTTTIESNLYVKRQKSEKKNEHTQNETKFESDNYRISEEREKNVLATVRYKDYSMSLSRVPSWNSKNKAWIFWKIKCLA